MNRSTAVFLLFVAAALEAGGDALVRAGLRSATLGTRAALFALGAVALFAYGWTVNAPPWDFGRVLGLYIVFFSRLRSLCPGFSSAPPSRSVLIGGLLIVSGGVVIALAQE